MAPDYIAKYGCVIGSITMFSHPPLFELSCILCAGSSGSLGRVLEKRVP